MDWKKMIGGRQFWTLIAVLFILLGVVILVGHPREEASPAPLPAAEDDVKVLVLNYHMVNTMFISLAIEPEDFEWQMKYLVDHGYHSITIDELYAFLEGKGTLPERPVLITFDDGYVDNYTNAYPILKKYNLKATIFIVTGFVSKRKGYLTWDQLREMERNGITAQSHTVTHAPLPELPDERIREELVASSSLPTRRACTIFTSSPLRRRRGTRAVLRSSTVMSTATAMSMQWNVFPSFVQRRRMWTSLIVCVILQTLPNMDGRVTDGEGMDLI